MSDADLRALEADVARDFAPADVSALAAARARMGLCPGVKGDGKPIPVHGPRERCPELGQQPSVLARARRPDPGIYYTDSSGLRVISPFVPPAVLPSHPTGALPASCLPCSADPRLLGRGTWRASARRRVDLILAGLPAEASEKTKRARLRQERGVHWGPGNHRTARKAWQEACSDALGVSIRVRGRTVPRELADAEVPLFGVARS